MHKHTQKKERERERRKRDGCCHAGWTGSRRLILRVTFFFLYWWRGLGRTEWQEEIRHWEVVENDTATNCARPRSRKDPVSFLSLAIIHPNTLILFMPITERDGQKRRDCCQNFARVQQKSINRIQGGVCSVISSRAEPHLLLSTVRFIRYLSPHRSSMASYSPLYRGGLLYSIFCIFYFWLCEKDLYYFKNLRTPSIYLITSTYLMRRKQTN